MASAAVGSSPSRSNTPRNIAAWRSGFRAMASRSSVSSRSSSSTWARIEMYSPTAIEHAPATRLARPASRTTEGSADAPTTPRISAMLVTRPSLMPSTAARAVPLCTLTASSICSATGSMLTTRRWGSVARDEIAAHVLDNLVTEKTGFHPSNGQEGRAGHDRAVENSVLRSAEAPRPMAHRDLDHAVAAHLQKRRDEAVKAAIEHEPAQAFPPEGAEGAAAIVDGFVGHPVAKPVGDPRRDAPDEAVALRALDAPAGRRVPVVEV